MTSYDNTSAKLLSALGAAVLLAACSRAFADPAAPAPAGTDRALTIYNQNFAVVRETVPLNLTAGVNNVTYNDITYHLEPDSVILRDPAGIRELQILEQNYRADPISQELLLSYYEGRTIDFLVSHMDHDSTVQGKIVRSGYVPHTSAYDQYGQGYYAVQQVMASSGAGQPLIEVDGKLQFGLPGKPIFPALTDDTILKPTIDWTINSDQAGPVNAELAYITDGMTWKADYNVVSPPNGDTLDLTGWVTIDNESGKTFDNAKIKLMAGDVSKIRNGDIRQQYAARDTLAMSAPAGQPPVSEQTFDEYHLYTLDRATTLRDRETKQVEFIRAQSVTSKVIYVYDGLQLDPNYYQGWGYQNIRNQPDYGTQSNTKVYVMREIVNSKDNKLGMPLPAGRMRFYRKDSDGQLEFIGENTIDHTPKDETLRVYTGNAFDLTGERRQTNYTIDSSNLKADESFEIKVRNHKTTPATVRVVEHLYRGATWDITAHSTAFVKKDAHTIEFNVTIPPDGEQVVTYTAHYTW